MFTFIETKTSYNIPLSIEQMQKLLDLDGITIQSGCLYTILDQIEGVADVDYDGHFGPNIFFSIESDHDNKQTRKAIIMSIDVYLNREVPPDSYPNRKD